MPLSPEAIEAQNASGCPQYPCKKIYVDQDFNCREKFTATDVLELARDIEKRGVVEPIVIRELWPNEGEIIAKGYEWSLVSGFRRFMAAYKVCEAEKIPAVLRVLNSDFDCRDINAIENLQRKDLSFWEEAKSIRHYWVADWTREQIAERINKSPGWVQLRAMLLEMPPEIQQMAANGHILQNDLRELSKYHGYERLKVAAQIRDARKAGEKGVSVKFKRKDKPNTKKARSAKDIEELMEYLRPYFQQVDPELQLRAGDHITNQGNCILGRILGWVAGNVTSLDMEVAVRDMFKQLGVAYEVRDFYEG